MTLGLYHFLTRAERWGQLYRGMIWLYQICTFALCGLAAFLLRFEFTIPSIQRRHLYGALLVWVVVKLIVFRLLNLDPGWWRFVSIHDLSPVSLLAIFLVPQSVE